MPSSLVCFASIDSVEVFDQILIKVKRGRV